MILLVHINAKGNYGYDKQISFLQWSMRRYKIPAQLNVVYGEAKGEYEIIKRKSESNRLYAISEYIKKRNLFKEDIMVLDPDTIFVKQIDASKYSLPEKTIRTQNYSRYIDMFSEHKKIAESVFGTNIKAAVCPFIGKGKTISELFDYSLYTLLGYYAKNLKSQWESGMFAMGAAMTKGNFNIVADNFWPVANFYEEDFVKNGYDGIHYGFEIKLKSGNSFKKWESFSSFNSEPLNTNHHVSTKFIEHLKEFENSQ
jgi:hypothetical protein